MTLELSKRENWKDSHNPFLTVSKLLSNVVKNFSVRDDGCGFGPTTFGESSASRSAVSISSFCQ